MRLNQWVFRWNREPFPGQGDRFQRRAQEVGTNFCMAEPPPLLFSVPAFLCVSEAVRVCLSVFFLCAAPTQKKLQQRAKVLITYRSNLADDSLKMWRVVHSAE